MDDPPLHTELALQAFEADKAFSAALASFQAQVSGHSTASLLELANAAGFCWLTRPADWGIEVVLRHVAGAEESAVGDDPSKLLYGLLGGGLGFAVAVPIANLPQPPNPEPANTASRTAKPTPERKPEAKPTPPAPEPPPDNLAAAADSLAAATSGHVFELAEGDPATPLSDGMKATAVEMLKELTAEQQKTFAIRFRDCFKIDKTEKRIAPCITELQHYKFIDDFFIEANGGVAR